MRTFIRYLFFSIMLLFVASGNVFSQGNGKSNNTPYYMENPSNTQVIKSIKRNHSTNRFGPLDDDCHTYNGDTITFINGVTSTIGSQVSPDIVVPQANQKGNETTCDPSIAISPLNKYNIFTAATDFFAIDDDHMICGIDQESGLFNGNTRTWAWSGGIINPTSAEGATWFNPAVEIYKHGDTLIDYTGSVMIYSYYNGGDQVGTGQGISYSTDGGISWTNKLIEFAYLGSHPDDYGYYLINNHLAIDNNSNSPYYGRAYSAWTPSANWYLGYTYSQLIDWGKIEFKYSTDRVNWPLYDLPLVISNVVSDTVPPLDSVLSYGVNLQIGNNGELYAVWAMYKNNPLYDTINPLSNNHTPLDTPSPPPYGPEFALGFTKSTNGGQSFDPAHVIINHINGVHEDQLANSQPFISTHGYNPFSFPVMCVDHSIVHPGRIYVAWSNIGFPRIDTGYSADIYVFHSDNSGQSWSVPVRINTEFEVPGHYKFSIDPWISCDNETGKVCVIFYDDRNYRDSRFDVYVCMSKDGGTTWEESHSRMNPASGAWGGINDSTFCTGGIRNNLGLVYFSTFNGIAVKDGLAYPIWTSDLMTPSSESHPYTTMSPYYIWNCIPDTVLFNYDLVYQDVQKFECQNYISTYDSVTISSDAFSFFDAGDSITIHPGFHAVDGSNFHAYIDGCEPFDGSTKHYSYYSAYDQGSNVYKSYLYDKLIKVYPNPTNGRFTVELGDFSGSDSKLVLLNSMNDSILEMQPSSQTTYSLDLSNYPKGIYFIKLFTHDRTYVNKIILQ